MGVTLDLDPRAFRQDSANLPPAYPQNEPLIFVVLIEVLPATSAAPNGRFRCATELSFMNKADRGM